MPRLSLLVPGSAAFLLLLTAAAVSVTRPFARPRADIQVETSRHDDISRFRRPRADRVKSTGHTPHVTSSGESSASPSAGEEQSLPAVRLADNVRLPVSLMPSPAGDPESSPAAALAKEAITAGFYREVAAKVVEKRKARSPEKPRAVDSTRPADDTVLVTPDAGVDEARTNADELFRVLFGDAAYNARGMASAVEVQLPPEP